YRRDLVAENKWRAIKDGLDGNLVDFGKEEEVPVRYLIEELLDIVDDVVDPLGVREEIEYVRVMLKQGSSADRQLRTHARTGELKAVVDQLAEETVMGL
ncbi:MAG: carboxylate-amine ligase, partial [Gemmatimonadetes bacterium]|nr:carboxylate-amine ligase [Gemmatimonadota bacterium]